MKFKSTDLVQMRQHYPEIGLQLTGRGKCLDLRGKKFNHLTPIYRSIDKRNRTGWVCLCDCGRYIFYNTDKLMSGEATTCGPTCPFKKQKTHELAGKRFGRLVVIERAGHSDDGHATWLCKCDCGNETIVEGRYLEHNRIKSCGGCPDTLISFGNAFIHKWLLEHSVNFRAEVRLPGCKYKNKLIFDFVIYNDKKEVIKCIEYQGTQHYFPTGGWSSDESVALVQTRDQIKKTYCEEHNIKLLCIPYTEYKNLDRILSDFIEEEN